VSELSDHTKRPFDDTPLERRSRRKGLTGCTFFNLGLLVVDGGWLVGGAPGSGPGVVGDHSPTLDPFPLAPGVRGAAHDSPPVAHAGPASRLVLGGGSAARRGLMPAAPHPRYLCGAQLTGWARGAGPPPWPAAARGVLASVAANAFPAAVDPVQAPLHNLPRNSSLHRVAQR